MNIVLLTVLIVLVVGTVTYTISTRTRHEGYSEYRWLTEKKGNRGATIEASRLIIGSGDLIIIRLNMGPQLMDQTGTALMTTVEAHMLALAILNPEEPNELYIETIGRFTEIWAGENFHMILGRGSAYLEAVHEGNHLDILANMWMQPEDLADFMGEIKEETLHDYECSKRN